ncbi:hypothetical protein ACFQ2B_37415 [Streptomyces stramineus]
MAEARQQPVQAEVLSHIKSLHRAALRVSNATLYEVQILQDQLEDADRAHQQAEVREQALLEALQARQHRIAELETERKQLEISWTTERMEFAQISGSFKKTSPSNRAKLIVCVVKWSGWKSNSELRIK